ncbi:MAG TPA: acetyl-CoA carboxylase carboxyl transferase subunit alpha, partial [Limnochordia bacterium]|nr:acetyl-CoA carboxylase carboxyl transferase subunit alpha [Limnochordia bacterium]
RDSSRAAEAAQLLRLTPTDLLKFGIIDDVITEPLGGAHRDHVTMGLQIRSFIRRYLATIVNKPLDLLVEERLAHFRQIGHFTEQALADL